MKKRTVLLIYGEKTVQINKRIPESKRKEIEDKFNAILKEYENPQRVEIDVANGKSVKNEIVVLDNSLKEGDEISLSATFESSPKKSTASGNDKWKDVRATDEEVAEAISKSEKIELAKSIVSGLKISDNGVLVKSKPSYDDLYDFEYVKSLPDIDNQVAIDSKGISLYDRYDVGIFYVKWEGKYLRFDNKAEFDRFAKDNSIK